MDFARKQLEKYGWTDGKGLGKYENGISQALKPKLKRSVTGVGHDAAAEFTEHWWTKLYNTAANNVEVKEKDGTTKKIEAKDDEFEITNSSWSYKKKNKSKSKEEYTNFFVKTSILTNGGVKMEDVDNRDEIVNETTDIVKLTDEELFAACEGRTAHKGARHGLKALGKLARIEMQEKMLLQNTKYKGYSQTKVEDTLLSDSEVKTKKKKKKKKHCSFSDTDVDKNMENVDLSVNNQDETLKDNCEKEDSKSSKKRKKNKINTEVNISNESENINENNVNTSPNNKNENIQHSEEIEEKSSKKRKKDKTIDEDEICNEGEIDGNLVQKKKTKKKKKDREGHDDAKTFITQNIDSNEASETISENLKESSSKKKNKRKVEANEIIDSKKCKSKNCY